MSDEKPFKTSKKIMGFVVLVELSSVCQVKKKPYVKYTCIFQALCIIVSSGLYFHHPENDRHCGHRENCDQQLMRWSNTPDPRNEPEAYLQCLGSELSPHAHCRWRGRPAK